MERELSVTELSEILTRILKGLSDSEYSSVEPILNEFQVQEISQCDQFLLNEREKYMKRNFHPLTAQISRILALSYRVQNLYPKWVEMMMFCLTPMYHSFLGPEIDGLWFQYIGNAPECVIDLTRIPKPFNITGKFVKNQITAVDPVSIIFTIKSQMGCEIQINHFKVTFSHSTENDITIPIQDTITLNPVRPFKLIKELSTFPPGAITVKSYSFKINNVEFIFNETRQETVAILPFEKDGVFNVNYPSFGMVKVPHPITLTFDEIPDGALKQTITARVVGGGSQFHFLNSENPKVFSQTIESISKSTETSIMLVADFQSTLEVELSSQTDFGLVNTHWQHTISIPFDIPFAIKYDVFSPSFQFTAQLDRIYAITNEPLVVNAVLNYRHPIVASITAVTVQTEFEQAPIDIELPLKISNGEEVTFAIVLYPTGEQRIASSGVLSIVMDVDGLKSSFQCQMPQVTVLQRQVEAVLSLPPVVEEQTRYTLALSARSTTEPFETEVVIGESPDFMFDGLTRLRHVRLQKEFTTILSLEFIALRTGRLEVPHISILYNTQQGQAVAWEQRPHIFVTSREVKPE